MKKIIAAAALIALFLLVVPANTVAASSNYGCDFDTVAEAAVLMNITTGEVLYEKNAEERLAPASTTKIMSAALGLSMCSDPDNTIVTVPNYIWNEFSGLNVSTANLQPGEELNMRELIYCMMLQSANEGASTLAYHYGWDEFISAMNAKAKALGCKDTYFSDPHGVFSIEHGGNYTTAMDLAKITMWAIKVPDFWDISCESRHYKKEDNKNSEVTLVSTVYMQDPSSDYYTTYIRGIKTGTTDESGRCFVSAAVYGDEAYLLVLLGCPLSPNEKPWPSSGFALDSTSFTETRLIYDWVFNNLKQINIVNTDDVVADINLKYSDTADYLLLYPDGELFTTINRNEDSNEIKTEYDCHLPESIEAPVEKGQIIGDAEVYRDGKLIGTVNLVSRSDAGFSRLVYLQDNITRILTGKVAVIIYIIAGLLVLLYIYMMTVVIPRKQKEHRRRMLQKAQQQNQVRRSAEVRPDEERRPLRADALQKNHKDRGNTLYGKDRIDF